MHVSLLSDYNDHVQFYTIFTSKSCYSITDNKLKNMFTNLHVLQWPMATMAMTQRRVMLGDRVGAYRIPNAYIRSTKVRNGPLPRFVMGTLTIVDNRQCPKLV